MTNVFCIGVWDMFHIGHLNLIEKARALGDRLIVGVVMDDAVTKQKGEGRPIVNFEHRCSIVSALKAVHEVWMCEDFDATKAIEQIEEAGEHINIFVLGEDQSHINWNGLEKTGIDVVQFMRTPDISTTELARKIQNGK